MEVVFLLVTVSLTLALFFLGIFIWSVRSGQYDDNYTPSIRILFDSKKHGNNTNQREGK